MINALLIKTLVEDAVKEGLLLRYPMTKVHCTVEYKHSTGEVVLLFPLPSRNLGKITLSIRGCDYIYQWLDRLATIYPNFRKYLLGAYTPEEFNDQNNW